MRAVILLLLTFAFCSRSLAQEEIIAFDIKGTVEEIGVKYADDTAVDTSSYSKEKWTGIFVYSVTARQGAIIWRSKQGEKKVQQLINLKIRLYRNQIETSPGRYIDVYTLAAAEDFASYPNNLQINAIYLQGNTAKDFIVQVPLTDLGYFSITASTSLKGEIWLLDDTAESFRPGKLKARYSADKSTASNLALSDNYNNDNVQNFDDVIDLWIDILRSEGWIPEAN